MFSQQQPFNHTQLSSSTSLILLSIHSFRYVSYGPSNHDLHLKSMLMKIHRARYDTLPGGITIHVCNQLLIIHMFCNE